MSSAPSSLVQIVPVLPPVISGVGDNAALLADELLAAQGVATRFVVGDPAWQDTRPERDRHPAAAVAARTPDALLQLLPPTDDPTPVLLHYVGYGYAKRGCPFWLASALERWKRDASAPRRLLVLFHETYASGDPVWSSAFWTSPLQKRVAGRIGRVADIRRITTSVAADELRAVGGVPPGGHLDVCPVFANLGEPTMPPSLAERRRQLVVFGTRHWRVEAYTRRLPDLVETCRRLSIERVVDVGSPLDTLPTADQLPIPLETAGPLPATEAGALFSQSFAGYFTYSIPFLSKSSIFGGYCAHGMLPVTFAENRDTNRDGLVAGVHYLEGINDAAPGVLQAVASAAHAWYYAHRLPIHAASIRQQMENDGLKASGQQT